MAADDDDSAVTRESPIDPKLGDGPGRVFAGRARPVLLPDLELTFLEEVDDPTEVRRWLGGVEEGASTQDRPHRTSTARLGHGAVVVGLLVVAMLVMAVVIALASR
ncbi:MAG: hypothetical protein ACM30G_15320 [Micromonosporaceae bacterium]